MLRLCVLLASLHACMKCAPVYLAGLLALSQVMQVLRLCSLLAVGQSGFSGRGSTDITLDMGLRSDEQTTMQLTSLIWTLFPLTFGRSGFQPLAHKHAQQGSTFAWLARSRGARQMRSRDTGCHGQV